MKRYIFLILVFCISMVAMAKPPHLNVEKLFDGSYNSEKSVEIHISKTKDKYYRGFTVNNNPGLVKKVTQLFKKDQEKAENSQDYFKDGGPSYSYMLIRNNNQDINIGIQYNPNNSCYLFITGSAEAFK